MRQVLTGISSLPSKLALLEGVIRWLWTSGIIGVIPSAFAVLSRWLGGARFGDELSQCILGGRAMATNWKPGLLYSLLTAILWGALPISLKVVLGDMDSTTANWYQFSISDHLCRSSAR